MKACTNKYCTNQHDTTYRYCYDCRKQRKEYEAERRGSAKYRIIEACNANKNLPLAQTILKILGEV